MQDDVNAFVSLFDLSGVPGGALSGLSFGAKDLFDISGHVTGYGNPEWARTHAPAVNTAFAVQALLDAGASLKGKTHTDELAYSLMGVNAHYGTPRNSADPRRVPGGSSSGSAAAVAAGLVDIGLGSDTGGSVRMPASFCGVWGLRSTFGLIPLEGAMPFTRSFDTVGWFAKDGDLMDRAAGALGCPAVPAPTRLLIPVDIWDEADAACQAALGPALDRLQRPMGAAEKVTSRRRGSRSGVRPSALARPQKSGPALAPGCRPMRLILAPGSANGLRSRQRSMPKPGLPRARPMTPCAPASRRW